MQCRDGPLRQLLMLGVLAGFGAGLHPLLGQPALTFKFARELRTDVYLHCSYFDPHWSGPGLLGAVCGDNDTYQPDVVVAHRDGHREYVRLRFGDVRISIQEVGGGADGALAVAGTAYAAGSYPSYGFVAWISPDRKQQTVTRVGPYFPDVVGIAADGSIWTAGGEVVDGKVPRHLIMRRFDKSGKLLRAFLPSAAVRTSIAPESSYLLASRDRMGWYFPHGNGYVEFSLDGDLLGRYNGVVAEFRQFRGVALSAEGELVAGRWDREASKFAALTLDRAKRAWIPVQLDAGEEPRYGWRLLGFDGNDLITSRGGYEVIYYFQPQRGANIRK